jgi:hypothetical protein
MNPVRKFLTLLVLAGLFHGTAYAEEGDGFSEAYAPDEAFSVDNKEHVKIANAIEVRLVDQDLMPLYADLGD